MLNSTGNTALVRCREVVRFSEGPLSEAQLYDTKRCRSIPCWAAFVCVVVGGRGNLAEPDPYAGGEGLVTC